MRGKSDYPSFSNCPQYWRDGGSYREASFIHSLNELLAADERGRIFRPKNANNCCDCICCRLTDKVLSNAMQPLSDCSVVNKSQAKLLESGIDNPLGLFDAVCLGRIEWTAGLPIYRRRTHNPLQCRLEHLYRSNYNPTTKIWTLFVGELPPHTVSPHPSL